MNQTLHFIDEKDKSSKSLVFPSPHLALKDPNGLLAVGGDLSPERLLSAYSQGIFPWFNEGDPILWWSPDPRGVILLDDLKINRSLKKVINKKEFTVTLNTSFDQVITLCAQAPFRKQGTWIIPNMQSAYKKLHKLGFAHSIEVWKNQKLVGGLYGVAINSAFSGESMFYTQSNASKVALVALATHLKKANIQYIDCQITNPFLADMGCKDMRRDDYLALQQLAKLQSLPEQFWQSKELPLYD